MPKIIFTPSEDVAEILNRLGRCEFVRNVDGGLSSAICMRCGGGIEAEQHSTRPTRTEIIEAGVRLYAQENAPCELTLDCTRTDEHDSWQCTERPHTRQPDSPICPLCVHEKPKRLGPGWWVHSVGLTGEIERCVAAAIYERSADTPDAHKNASCELTLGCTRGDKHDSWQCVIPDDRSESESSPAVMASRRDGLGVQRRNSDSDPDPALEQSAVEARAKRKGSKRCPKHDWHQVDGSSLFKCARPECGKVMSSAEQASSRYQEGRRQAKIEAACPHPASRRTSGKQWRCLDCGYQHRA